jgi:hypothetical protein
MTSPTASPPTASAPTVSYMDIPSIVISSPPAPALEAPPTSPTMQNPILCRFVQDIQRHLASFTTPDDPHARRIVLLIQQYLENHENRIEEYRRKDHLQGQLLDELYQKQRVLQNFTSQQTRSLDVYKNVTQSLQEIIARSRQQVQTLQDTIATQAIQINSLEVQVRLAK